MFNIIESVYRKMLKIPDVSLEELYIASPISTSELSEIEKKINFTFPEFLREMFIHFFQSVSFNWTSNGIYGEDCRIGGIRIDPPRTIADNYLEMLQMVNEANMNQDELEENEGLKVMVNDWPHWIPIISFMNGDAFCINKKDNSFAVVFLEHDVMDGGPYIHGLQIASNVEDLLNRWSQIGFVEVNDWSEYTNDNGLDIESPVFAKIREVLFKA